MGILTVDMLDRNKIAISFDDGATAVYEEAQLRTLQPTQVIHDDPGVGQDETPTESSD